MRGEHAGCCLWHLGITGLMLAVTLSWGASPVSLAEATRLTSNHEVDSSHDVEEEMAKRLSHDSCDP